MGLFNLSKPPPADDDRPRAARATAPVDAVEKVRTRTRQRLIGAVVLLGIGVIGFPLLFESQPRPIPIDIPIDIPKPEAVPPLVLPEPTAATAEKVDAAPPAAEASAALTSDVAEVPAEPASAAASPAPASASASASAASPTSPSPPTPSAAALPAPVPASAAASAAERELRYVVQVGAFVEPEAAQDVRRKLEKLGMKTYAQVAQTNAGRRTRVRLGPFTTRAEADKALARAQKAGIDAVVLKL